MAAVSVPRIAAAALLAAVAYPVIVATYRTAPGRIAPAPSPRAGRRWPPATAR